MIKKKTTAQTPKQPSKVAKMLLVFFLLTLFYVLFGLSAVNDKMMRKVTEERQGWVNAHMDKFAEDYDTLFTAAKECSNRGIPAQICKVQNRNMIDEKFGELFDKGQLGRLPIFFVRVQNENTVEKMYQSGEYKIEKIDTPAEELALKFFKKSGHLLRIHNILVVVVMTLFLSGQSLNNFSRHVSTLAIFIPKWNNCFSFKMLKTV